MLCIVIYIRCNAKLAYKCSRLHFVCMYTFVSVEPSLSHGQQGSLASSHSVVQWPCIFTALCHGQVPAGQEGHLERWPIAVLACGSTAEHRQVCLNC